MLIHEPMPTSAGSRITLEKQVASAQLFKTIRMIGFSGIAASVLARSTIASSEYFYELVADNLSLLLRIHYSAQLC